MRKKTTKKEEKAMDETIYRVELGDGTTFENLTLNGNNYVSQSEITEEDFTDLTHVIITGSDGSVQELGESELVQVAHYSDGWYFILRELTAAEISRRDMEAQTFYTAMMTDTLIEEG